MITGISPFQQGPVVGIEVCEVKTTGSANVSAIQFLVPALRSLPYAMDVATPTPAAGWPLAEVQSSLRSAK